MGSVCLSVCVHVHIGIDKGFGEEKAVLFSPYIWGAGLPPMPRVLLRYLPPSSVPVSLTHISQVLFLGPGLS